jgi:hypothetical protein
MGPALLLHAILPTGYGSSIFGCPIEHRHDRVHKTSDGVLFSLYGQEGATTPADEQQRSGFALWTGWYSERTA